MKSASVCVLISISDSRTIGRPQFLFSTLRICVCKCTCGTSAYVKTFATICIYVCVCVCVGFKLFAFDCVFTLRTTISPHNFLNIVPFYVATKLSEAKAGISERLRVWHELRLLLISPETWQPQLHTNETPPNYFGALTQFVGECNSFLRFAFL